MYFHMTFEDGSNPYVMYGTEAQLRKELKKWEENYYLIVNRVCERPLDFSSRTLGFNVYAVAHQPQRDLFKPDLFIVNS